MPDLEQSKVPHSQGQCFTSSTQVRHGQMKDSCFAGRRVAVPPKG